MNISHDGTIVSFKTEPEELFLAEKSGAKPNTVRILDFHEFKQLVEHKPKKIIIQHKHELFFRTITNIYTTNVVFGRYIVVFSWTNEAHHYLSPVPCASCKPTPSLDDGFVAIRISRQMFNILQNCFSGRTMDSVVQELYETYLDNQAYEVSRKLDQ